MKKKLPILLSVIAGAALCASAAVIGAKKPVVADEIWGTDAIAEEYAFGTSFSVPDKSVTVGDKTERATAVVQFPDGSSSYADSVKLDQYGTYTVKYSAMIGDSVYHNEETFTVNSRIFSCSSTSSVKYGKHTQAKEKEGLLVSLAQGDTLTFTEYFDVEDLTAEEDFLEIFATPENTGVFDFSRFVFTLTDSLDPDCYIKIVSRRRDVVPDSGRTFVYAGANGQDMVGVEGATIHRNNQFGTLVNHSFDRRFSVTYYDGVEWKDAKHEVEYIDQLPMRLAFDYQTKELYVEHDTFDRYGVKNNEASQFVTDFDNPTYYDTAFAGFPSGKVRLSISTEANASATAKFCISKALNIDLSKEAFLDGGAPVITVDNPYDVMPEGKVNSGYPIPTATAYDLYSGDCDVSVSVWYNYHGETPVMADVKEGKFLPKYVGFYAIVYKAVDAFGNVAEEIVWVHVGGEYAPLNVSYDETQAVDNAYVGEKVAVAPYTVSGGSGATSVQVYAVNGDTRLAVDGGFIPETEGTWTVFYEATDFIGNKKITEYTVNVVCNPKPILVEEIQLPKIFLSGYAYTLPKVYAKHYSSGGVVDKLCDVTVFDNNGEKTYKAGDVFNPTVQSSGDFVTLTYSCEGAVYQTAEIPAVQAYVNLGTEDAPDYLLYDVQNYFHGNGLSYQKTNTGIVVSAQQTGDSSFLFANTLIGEGFTIDMRTIPAQTDFSEIEFLLTDAENYGNEISLRLVNKGNYIDFIVGENVVKLETSFASGSEERLIVSYYGGVASVGKNALSVAQTTTGKPFAGFNDKVYLQVNFKGEKEGSAVKIYGLCGHRFTTDPFDMGTPYYAVKGHYGGSQDYNSYYTLPAVCFGDVIDPNLSITMSVKNPNGDIVTDVNGVRLENVDTNKEYTIRLDSYGKYNVYYQATESSTFVKEGQSGTFNYALTVADKTAPTIRLTSDYVKTAKVGDVLVMPTFSVSDDLTKEDDIVVFKMVINPNGRTINLTDKANAIECMYAGIYEFRIIAKDKTGNMAMLSIYVTVSEGGAV